MERKNIMGRKIRINNLTPEQLHKLLRRIERWFNYEKQMDGSFTDKQTHKVWAWKHESFINFIPRMFHRDKNGFLIARDTTKEKPIYFH